MIRIATESGDGFHAPSISDFYPDALFGDGTFYEFNRILLVRVIATIGLLAIMGFVAKRATVVPSRGQSIVELILGYLRENVVYGVLGEEVGKRYDKLLITIFFAIFAFNITGTIPGLNIASTGLIGVTLVLAVLIWVVYLTSGIIKHGFVGYWKYSLFPSGAALAVKPLIALVDLAQIVLIRPATLALRLTINMIVGHLLLALTYSATQYFWVDAASNFNIAYGFITFFGIFFMTALEVFVAVLQAFIFVMLSAVYINMAVSEDH
ncbi:F0F1 ATP synthase subunit A [Demequina capsici]|uniref:ATP synthase subunit a n=1 Tax=Demequina capsici TaxID=3075620 RepID=A0AA96JB04_9MICO|nr:MULTISPECIES: F0F1 ATP synthase subunit A [unclassified Demequina]WNM25981.1 F0F1 ATP synthase subunit A [Demequina sp. OYTSA14]WNM28857.1 F0F1 ATP synthase subunit A [Demequina sp. PMTSA13]